MKRISLWSRPESSAQPTILEMVRARLDPSGCGLLDNAEALPGELADGEIRWAPGALDGVGSHHAGHGEDGGLVSR